MPEDFGAWPTVHNRFRQWRDAGVFDALLEGVIAEAANRGEVDLSLVSVDSTIARAHHDAAGMHLGSDLVAALEKAAEEETARQKVLPRRGRFVAFQGAVTDVFAFHPGQRGEHGEHHAGWVVGALQFAGEEFQADAGRLQLLGEGGQVEAAPEPLVLVHHERGRHPGRAQFPGQGDGLVELGPDRGAGGDFLGEDAGDAGWPEALWQVWALAGPCLWLLGLFRGWAARLVWILYGAATVAMVYAASPPTGQTLAGGLTVLVWAVLSLPVLAGIGRRPRTVVQVSAPAGASESAVAMMRGQVTELHSRLERVERASDELAACRSSAAETDDD